jgi:hypothetical protein
MAQYRLYPLTSTGRALGAPIVIERDDDEAALLAAREMRHPYIVEVWERARMVGRVPPVVN